MKRLVLRYRRPTDDPTDALRVAVVRPGYVFRLPTSKPEGVSMSSGGAELVAFSDLVSCELVLDEPELSLVHESGALEAEAEVSGTRGTPSPEIDGTPVSSGGVPVKHKRWGLLPFGEEHPS